MREVSLMNDLNFFINPNAKKESSNLGIFLLSSIIVVAIGVGGFFWFMTARNNRVSQDIASIEAQLASPQVVEGQAKVDLTKQQLKLLEQYDQELTTIESALSPDDKIKKALFDTVSAAFPPSITLTSLRMNSSELSLEAVSTNATANAELIRNLKNTGLFSSVDLLAVNKTMNPSAAPTEQTLQVHASLKEVTP
jgi:Tfp pilus assembly protein PilN